MKKVIAALSVFAFVLAFSGNSIMAMTGQSASYTVVLNDDKDPKADGTKKTAKADKKSSDCSSTCGDKSAKASSDCGSKKATTAEAKPASDKK